jgi:fatty acid desaturase
MLPLSANADTAAAAAAAAAAVVAAAVVAAAILLLATCSTIAYHLHYSTATITAIVCRHRYDYFYQQSQSSH